MISPVIFNFNDYLKNPIADFCVSKYPSKTVYTLDDLQPEIQKLRHSKWAIENNLPSYVGDQLRLHLATLQDNFLYVDADCYVSDFSELISSKNCTEYIQASDIINNGTFFYSDKDCRFNKYYLDLYEKLPEKEMYLCNYQVFKKYPFELDINNHISGDMNLISIKSHHFTINKLYRFKRLHPDVDKIYLTRNPKIYSIPIVWQIEKCPSYVASNVWKGHEKWFFETNVGCISQDDMIRLFKEQMEYVFQRKITFKTV